MPIDPTRPRVSLTPQAVIGLLIVIWGLVLTAGNIGWLEPYAVRRVLGWWPIIIIGLGAAKIVSARSASDRTIGIVVVFLGLWFLVGVRELLPLLLVALGVFLIVRARASGGAGGNVSEGGAEFAFWSGIERRISVPDFRGANLTAIMGGIEMDLRGAGTASGDAVIDVFAVMGGIEITVPPDWAVINRVTPIIGGVEDKTTGGRDAQHRLIVRGSVIMGGVEIKT